MKLDDESETTELKSLSESDLEKLKAQNSRVISAWHAGRLEVDAKKHWDLFYKRNENRFFKDRHWTTREFKELINLSDDERDTKLLELGCGTGNLVYPLLEEGLSLECWVCDISPRALNILRNHELFDENIVHPLLADITVPKCFADVPPVDLITTVFVLSTIDPSKTKLALENAFSALKPGGLLLIRDYARWDMTQLRFGPGRKISENFYARHDGTRYTIKSGYNDIEGTQENILLHPFGVFRLLKPFKKSYFFTIEELDDLCTSVGFHKVSNVYINRRTINKKEDIDVPRIFIQAKFSKPLL